MKRYSVTVEYDLYATSEHDAVEQIFNNRVDPETVDVVALPARQKVELDIVAF